MPDINLLPWRETQHKEQQKRFMVLLAASIACSFLIIVIFHFQMGRMIKNQESRNRFLQTTISTVEINIQKTQAIQSDLNLLIKNSKEIQRLQLARNDAVLLFSHIANTLPEQAVLTKLIQHDGYIQIFGYARSSKAISLFLENIEKSDWFDDLHLDSITTAKNNHLLINKFSLKIFTVATKTP